MRTVMTWSELLVYLAISNAVYYCIVISIFFRRELRAMVLRRGETRARVSNEQVAKGGAVEEAAHTDASLYHQVHELLEECKLVFRAAADESLDKSQLLEALQYRLRKYPSVRGTSFQISVTNHIEQEVEHRCQIRLTEQELEELWQ